MPFVVGICHRAAPAPACLSPTPWGRSARSPEPHSPESPWRPHLVDRAWRASQAKESLQEGLEGICRGQGGCAGLGLMAHLGAMPSRGEWASGRAVPRRVNVRCCLAASWARARADLFNPIWRGGRGGGGLFPRLNLVGFSYSRFRIWAANWCSFGTGGMDEHRGCQASLIPRNWGRGAPRRWVQPPG